MTSKSDLIRISNLGHRLLPKVTKAIRYKVDKRVYDFSLLLKNIAASRAAIRLRISKELSYNLAYWEHKKAPLYCVDSSFLDSVLNTKVDEAQEVIETLFKEERACLPSAVFLLPRNSLVINNISIEILCVALLVPKDLDLESFKYEGTMFYPEFDHAKTPKGLFLVECLTSDLARYSLQLALHDEKNFTAAYKDKSTPVKHWQGEEFQVIADVCSFLACKLWLSLSDPNLVEHEEETKGFGKTHNARESSILTPRWIGRNYQAYLESQSQGEGEKGTHRSPIPHWRKEHKRRVRYGPGRSLVKEVIITKRYVNDPEKKQTVKQGEIDS